MRISRPCYDKYHRCPGWAGGGMRYAETNKCPNLGYVAVDYDERLWRWRLHRCNKCGVLVLPTNIRYIDPTYWTSMTRVAVHGFYWRHYGQYRHYYTVAVRSTTVAMKITDSLGIPYLIEDEDGEGTRAITLDELYERLASLKATLDALHKGTAANGSRDYGRGVAHAVRKVREAVGTTRGGGE